MANKLLDSHDHICFHSPVCNVHQHPDLNHCHEQFCAGAITTEMAKQAGYLDEDGFVRCPLCNCHTSLNPGKKIAEIHVKLCRDETIHYPDWRKSAKITEEQFQTWKATLTRDELLGYYKRVPDVHLMVQFTHEETALMDTDLPAFNALLQTKLRARAELTLLHSVEQQHTTTSKTIKL
jgi:hypothetical protein